MPIRPVAGSTFTFPVNLVSQANTKIHQASPTVVAGDFMRSINGGDFANLDNTPVVTPSATTQVLVILSAAETTSAGAGGFIDVRAEDASSAQWCSLSIVWFVAATDNDSLATAAALTVVGDATLAAITALGVSVGDVPTAAEIWANVTRNLTQTAAEVQAVMTGGDLHITRAVTYSATLTGLTIPVGWDKIYFTVKKYKAVADTDAIVQIVVSNPAAALTDGLLRINKAAGTLAQGSLVVGATTLDISLADDATVLLVSDSYVYDVKAIVDGTSVLLTAADATVADAVTETIG